MNNRKRAVTKTLTPAVLAIGGAALVSAFSQWQCNDPWRYASYFALCVISSGWRVGLPASPGALSVGFVFILMGIADLSLPETMLMGCSALVVESLRDPRERTQLGSIVIRMASVAIAISAAFKSFQDFGGFKPESQLWLPMLGASAVFSLLHTFPLAAYEAPVAEKGLGRSWHEQGYYSLPHYLLSAFAAAAVCSLGRSIGWQYALPTLPLLYSLYRAASIYTARVKGAEADSEMAAAAHYRTLEALGLAIGARYRVGGDQLTRTQRYALWIADDLMLDRDRREALRIAALLHDVGTLAVPEQIMCKHGRLTAEEFDKVKVHPVVGAAIVGRADFPVPVAPIVRSHHERWNGGGYPDGLSRNAIPVGARILAVADCLASLTTDRPYRPAVPFDRAMAFVAAQSGVAFDPKVVDIVLRRAAEFESIAPAPVSAVAEEVNEDSFLAPISAARRESQQVYELAQELGSTLSLSETLTTLALRLRPIVPFDCMVLWVLRGDALIPEYVDGPYHSSFYSLQIPLGGGVSGGAARHNKPVLNGGPLAEFQAANRAPEALDLQSALAAPLEGALQTVGVLTLYQRKKNAFQANDLRILLGIRPKLAAAVENAVLYKQATESATTDHLTGLPNARSLFRHLDDEVSRCRRTSEPMAVLVCDLDGFKDVNDRFGHLAGNKVLQAVGQALQRNCRGYDYVARLGGDEFVVVLPGLPKNASATRKRYLSLVVTEAAQRACPGSRVTLSVGEARFPEMATNAEQLLRLADERMYENKNRRKSHLASRGYDFDAVEVTPP